MSSTFGVPLDRTSNTIPTIIQASVDYFANSPNAYKEEGLFRISGGMSIIESYKDKWNQGIVPDLTEEDPHVVAGVLKLYFRDLPVPLLTFELYDCFLIAGAVDDDLAGVKSMKNALLLLPLINLLVIKSLVTLLGEVTKYSEINKMIPSNLAIVFAPSLLRREDESDITLVLRESKDANKLMERLILHASEIFEGPEWMGIISQKQKELQSKSMPQFVVPKKPIPRPPSVRGESSPMITRDRAGTLPLNMTHNEFATPPRSPAPQSPNVRSPSRSGAANSPLPPFRPPLTSSSASNNTALTKYLLEHFTRICLGFDELGAFVCIGTKEDNKVRVAYQFSSDALKSSQEIYKPVSVGDYLTFKHKTKFWCVDSNGFIATRPFNVPDSELPDRCFFSARFDERDRLLLTSKSTQKPIGFVASPPYYLSTSNSFIPLQIAIKVSLQASNGVFLSVESAQNRIAVTGPLKTQSQMHLVQIEDKNNLCSIFSIGDDGSVVYWCNVSNSLQLTTIKNSTTCLFEVSLSGKTVTIKSSNLFLQISAKQPSHLVFGPAANPSLQSFTLAPFAPSLK